MDAAGFAVVLTAITGAIIGIGGFVLSIGAAKRSRDAAKRAEKADATATATATTASDRAVAVVELESAVRAKGDVIDRLVAEIESIRADLARCRAEVHKMLSRSVQ